MCVKTVVPCYFLNECPNYLFSDNRQQEFEAKEGVSVRVTLKCKST